MAEDKEILQDNGKSNDAGGYRMLQEEAKLWKIVSDRAGVVELGTTTGIGGYAEMFETLSGRTIDCGYFVTLQGRKVVVANSRDRYILGVTTATPTVLGNNGDVRWKNKYLTDEWGRMLYEEVLVPALHSEDGNVLIPEHMERKPIINPKWDKNQAYIPRQLRPEWVAVALIGQVLVRDNGTCRENGYCIPNDEGMATAAPRGYRVLERRGPDQVLILLRSVSFNMGGTIIRQRTGNG
ncbi:peptidase G2 autoproteolytic cleavage domain-containing protein [Clostridium thermarum]|uniref:peptidase G2 autoproteolytic cleavage domain-containing protein n=1 Tax=Clostridium thermarum TaxID=1716543 RepID=UPI0013D01661|nr:peptidase G2 autoproteolytic cleavage domain-containing protein [Clostridium thermarum]